MSHPDQPIACLGPGWSELLTCRPRSGTARTCPSDGRSPPWARASPSTRQSGQTRAPCPLVLQHACSPHARRFWAAPAKFQLKNTAGQLRHRTRIAYPVTGSAMTTAVDETVYTTAADSGSTFKYDATACSTATTGRPAALERVEKVLTTQIVVLGS